MDLQFHLADMNVPTLRRLLLLVLAVAPLGASAGGDIYRYVEKDGTIVYTNVRQGKAKGRRVSGKFSRAPRPNEPANRHILTPSDYEDHIDSAARRYNIPRSLVRAVMHAESNFDRTAVSHKGASGLMQLMPATAEEMYVKDIFDVRENIEGGTRYLRVLANLFDGDMVKMVAAYNAGPEAVRKYGGAVPPYAETQAYVRKVIQLYYHYKERERLAMNEARGGAANGDDAGGTGREGARR